MYVGDRQIAQLLTSKENCSSGNLDLIYGVVVFINFASHVLNMLVTKKPSF